MFNPFNIKEKLPRRLQKMLQPRKEFKEQTKTAFLAVFDAANPNTRTSHSITAAARAFIAGGALVAIFAGVSVYADTANVPADSTLYPLKRLSENVQLALTPVAQKPQLQATFADRRAAEISDLSTRKPTSTIIAGLDNDLDSDVDNSISAAVATDLGDGKLNAFCGKVLSAIATSSMALHDQLSIHPKVLARFENECAASGGGNANESAYGNESTATTTIVAADFATTTAASTNDTPAFTFPNPFSPFSSTTSTVPTSTFHASTTFHVRGGGSLNLIFNNPPHEESSTQPTSPTPFVGPKVGRPRSGAHGQR
jgi:hypothetical protein